MLDVRVGLRSGMEAYLYITVICSGLGEAIGLLEEPAYAGFVDGSSENESRFPLKLVVVE